MKTNTRALLSGPDSLHDWISGERGYVQQMQGHDVPVVVEETFGFRFTPADQAGHAPLPETMSSLALARTMMTAFASEGLVAGWYGQWHSGFRVSERRSTEPAGQRSWYDWGRLTMSQSGPISPCTQCWA